MTNEQRKEMGESFDKATRERSRTREEVEKELAEAFRPQAFPDGESIRVKALRAELERMG